MTYTNASPSRRSVVSIAPGRVLLVMLVVAGLSRLMLYDYSPWFDEFASLWFSRQPVDLLWSEWMVRETNPPLYYTMLKGWRLVFGDSLFSLRSLSITGSVLAIAFCYKLVVENWGTRAALTAALFATLSGQHLIYAQQMRGYIFVYLGVVVSAIGLFRIAGAIEGGGSRYRDYALYITGATFAIYCHTTAILWPVTATMAILLVYFRLINARIKVFISLIAADLAVAILSLWWLWITFLQVSTPQSNISWIESAGAFAFIKIVFKATLLAASPITTMLPAGIAILIALLLLPLFRFDARSKLLVAIIFSAIAVFAVGQLVVPIVLERTLFWISIFTMIGAAVSLACITNVVVRRLGIAGVACLLLLNLVSSTMFLGSENWLLHIAIVSRDANAVLLVDGDGMAVATQSACEMSSRKGCPFKILVLSQPGSEVDRWAEAPASVTHVTSATLVEAIPRSGKLYIYRRFGHDPVNALHKQHLLLDVLLGEPALVGPISWNRLRARAG